MEHLFSGKRMIDLTLPYNENIAGFQSEAARELAKDGWNAEMLHIYSHAGTHMDAPFHFGLEGTIDQYTPDQLIGKAWLVNIKEAKSNYLIGVEDIAAIKEKVQQGDSILLRTDWSKHLNNRSLYRDQLPRISVQLAEWLVEKKVKMLGVEPPSVADVNNLEEVSQIHHILLAGGIIIIEGLKDLDQIQTESVLLFAFPLKIKDGDGAPARVIALEL